MCRADRCVLCNSGEIKDLEHFLSRCEEFRWERQDLSEKVGLMGKSELKCMEG